MSAPLVDTPAVVTFLATIRPDWNLGSIATHLHRQVLDHPEPWTGIVDRAVHLALTDPAATPAALHTPSATRPCT